MNSYRAHTHIYKAGWLAGWLAGKDSEKSVLSFIDSEPFDGFREKTICFAYPFHFIMLGSQVTTTTGVYGFFFHDCIG